ncbi:hypothetical protein D3C76_1616190 [compost metagenome]
MFQPGDVLRQLGVAVPGQVLIQAWLQPGLLVVVEADVGADPPGDQQIEVAVGQVEAAAGGQQQDADGEQQKAKAGDASGHGAALAEVDRGEHRRLSLPVRSRAQRDVAGRFRAV